MTGSGERILIVDDEAPIRSALRTTLSGLGFAVSTASRGEEALKLAETSDFDVVLLDVNMPGLGGVETCRRLRSLTQRPSIIMLTVRDLEDDKVEALEAGADDYVTKPFHVRELVARIRASVRKSHARELAEPQVMRIGDIELNVGRRMVTKCGQLIHFTPKEFDLLQYMMENAGLPIRHAKLLKAVWGPEYGYELEYLRTFIRQMRKKIEDDPANPRYLLTDAHFGYRFSKTGS